MQSHNSNENNVPLNAVMDTVLDGLIIINDKGIIQNFNPAAEKIFGYKTDDVIGKNVKMLMPDPYHSEHDQYIKNYHETGEKKIMGVGREISAKKKDGTVFPVELGISEMVVDSKRMFVGMIRDITEQKNSEKLNRQLLQKLMESNEELEKFAYIASHDLQEPLRMINNFNKLLLSDFADDFSGDAKKYLKISCDAAERMRLLIEDLLNYARIRENLDKSEKIHLKTAMDYVLENLAMRIKETNAEIEFDEAGELYGNKTQFHRLLQNIISNSLKYRKPDISPKIKITSEKEDYGWKFCIEDNGIGMKQEYCKQIFDPFKRLHTKNKYSGSGMGLSICKKIVENFGGKIWAESEQDIGSKFFFTIHNVETIKKNKEAE